MVDVGKYSINGWNGVRYSTERIPGDDPAVPKFSFGTCLDSEVGWCFFLRRVFGTRYISLPVIDGVLILTSLKMAPYKWATGVK